MMLDLPPLVSKGSPIRAADQNKLINAVRRLAASNIAGIRGGNMQRSRAVGKKRPFEVSVYCDAAKSSVVASVEPGVWHGNRETVPAGIVPADSGDGADADTWIVGVFDADSGEYKPTEITVPASGYIVLYATLTDGKVSDVSIGFATDSPKANNDESGVIATVVAYVSFEWAEKGITNLTVLQYLNGDFWLGEKGGDSGESYAGNPFAWTKVGENTWQLRKVVLMVTPHQIYGTDGVSGVGVIFDTAGDIYTPTRSDTTTDYDTAPLAPNSYIVLDGLCVGADMEDGAAVLVYAEVDGLRNLSWRTHNVYDLYGGGSTEGAPFPLPWVPQRMTAALTFDITRALAGNAYDLTFRLEGKFDDEPVAQFRVSVPMAIIARNGDSTTLVPIRHGMIEVRPALALGFRMYQGTEFVGTAIDRNDINGTWSVAGVDQKEFVD